MGALAVSQVLCLCVRMGMSSWASVHAPEMALPALCQELTPPALDTCRHCLLSFLPAPCSYCLIHTLTPEGLWVLISNPGSLVVHANSQSSSESYSILTLGTLQLPSLQGNAEVL